jgi:hypothetical protein
MISTKFIGSAAALALIAALSAPTASFAFHGGHGGFGGHAGGFGGRPAMGARGPSASFASAGPARGPGAFNGGRTAWNGNNGAWRGGDRGRGGGFWPGVATGAAVGALGSYAYYGGPDYGWGPDYYDDTYYDNGYYDNGATVAVVPGVAGADAGYCAQRYRSYDPASGTYLGFDGQRHPCP